ncbi:conjugal transfer protein TraX [Tissierella sp. MSJ-40]|uniref:Conjugal transfer protein TraX n=1 Tax=Tissierella simiarum TaxID=2841534 RepID=A0ABS6EBH9_9FIRM|nr:TraX family protein [Tissierella simiarum]MBU5439554.1 conjugal transfer protein TraX [Tissierella simiarum]
MSFLTLKIIGILSMLFDHVDRIFPVIMPIANLFDRIAVNNPSSEQMVYKIFDIIVRVIPYIGRLAAPIFMFCIANGYMHTHNVKKYIARITIFALISQIPYILFFKRGMGINFEDIGLNIMFTLGLGLIAIYAFDKLKQKNIVLAFGVVVLTAILAFIIHAEGREVYIIIIFMFYLLKDIPKNKRAVIWIFIIILSRLRLGIATINDPNLIRTYVINVFGQYLGVLVTFFYNGEKGKSNKFIQYFMYGFYPAHLLILALLRNLVNG